MSNAALFRRLSNILSEILGLGLDDLIGTHERIQHVRTTAVIGIAVGAFFAAYNFFVFGMRALGLAQIVAVVFFLLPALWLSQQGRFIRLAEDLIVAAALVIFMALIVLGGIAGTGLFWVYSFPFLVFFMKGQKQGWWYSFGFLALVISYFFWWQPRWPFAYPYPPLYSTHFILAMVFYTFIASAFNLLRTRFEEQLQARVVAKTAVAKAYLEQLQFLASHDSVTDLPNRVRLLELLNDRVMAANAGGAGLAVCSLRVERLFELGNVLGIEGADGLVRQVAEFLKGRLGREGLLARVQRDEFLIVHALDRPTLEPAALRPLLIEHAVSVQEQGYTLHLEFTQGVSVYPIHAEDPQMLLSQAEQAMLQARKIGQPWSLYDKQMDAVFVRHHLLFGKLRKAIADGHLQIHYQPQVDLASGRVVGAEALARWHESAEGPIPPSVFIPVAEESGLIRPMTAWLAREAMRECARWHALGLDLDVSINISALSLQDPDLIGTLVEAAGLAGLPTGRVNLELTESCFMGSPERTLEVMNQMHDAGFRLSIDDFGTGYSSLSYLKYLPINELKIDQSFVRKLVDSASDQAIVVSTIELAHNFGLSVVAEGIEDAPTADWLHGRRCDVGQGYGFARPMPVDDFVAFARDRQALVTGESA